ncbi:MAG: acetyl-CoA hydrolase/transferase C-terminal domain-containing protein [Actinomycetota bacterium]|nr:acetyl-CoA hydrolase/transferase C-terminal domain-containing protein [Actinomycetota bacterium]
MTTRLTDVGACVDEILARRGRRLDIATPLGLGKATTVLAELYRRAEADPSIELTIHTALDVAAPTADSALAARLLDPITERLFGGYREPPWAHPLRAGQLPDNVRVRSFYFSPGSLLASADAQQHHVNVNYSEVADRLAEHGIDVAVQLVVPGPDGTLSLGTNPDVTLDLLDRLADDKPLTIAEVNPQLPYLEGDAVVGRDTFDVIVDPGDGGFPLAGPPRQPLSTADHAIGLHAATLVPDGGTIQVGIGALGDAFAWHLLARRRHNGPWRALVDAVGGGGPAATRIGGLDELTEGLFGSSELLSDALLDLLDGGVLRRAADADDPRVLHAGFALGSRSFLQRLANLDDETRSRIGMSRISWTNTLDGDRDRKIAQRRGARFVNTAMAVTLLGAASSDSLPDGRVVSGVGGQADFVAMAHELPGGRSVLLCRAVRDTGKPSSNIVASHGACTIPRQQRDLVVTEYGVADLRGRTDAEVVAELLNVADSRFQDGLRDDAVAAGKLRADHRIPDRYRANTPEALARRTAGHTELTAPLPFGSELTPIEHDVRRALRHLEQVATSRGRRVRPRAGRAALTVPDAARAHLERMGLDRPTSATEHLEARAVAYALAATGALDANGTPAATGPPDLDTEERT